MSWTADSPNLGLQGAVKTRVTYFLSALIVMLLVATGVASAAPIADAPYVQPDGEGGWTARRVGLGDADRQVQTESIAVGQRVTIPAIGDLPAFEVRLRSPAEPAPDQIMLSAGVPLFVAADTHGEYEILVELLQKQKVIDDKLGWSFGKGRVTFLGDVFDRGAHQTEILWLIYKLEAEAAEAGGAVHLLLGNHESIVLRGDVRYLNPKYVQTAEALGVASYSDLFSPATLLGQWLRSKSAVLKLGHLLLVHGGISPELVERDLSLSTINRTVRGVLDGSIDAEQELPTFVMKSSGPLWYRGYFPMDDAPPAATPADVEAALRHFGVDTILVGHTIVPEVAPLYGGKVIAVQVYPRRDEDTGAAIMEGALREGGAWYRARADGSRQLLTSAESLPSG